MSEPVKNGREHLDYLLTAYLFENISEEGRREVEAHLAQCQECWKVLLELRETLAAAEGAFRATERRYLFEERRRERILEAARRAKMSVLAQVGLPDVNWKVAATAALLMVLVLGGLILPTMSRARQSAGYSTLNKKGPGIAVPASAPEHASKWGYQADDSPAAEAPASRTETPGVGFYDFAGNQPPGPAAKPMEAKPEPATENALAAAEHAQALDAPKVAESPRDAGVNVNEVLDKESNNKDGVLQDAGSASFGHRSGGGRRLQVIRHGGAKAPEPSNQLKEAAEESASSTPSRESKALVSSSGGGGGASGGSGMDWEGGGVAGPGEGRADKAMPAQEKLAGAKQPARGPGRANKEMEYQDQGRAVDVVKKRKEAPEAQAAQAAAQPAKPASTPPPSISIMPRPGDEEREHRAIEGLKRAKEAQEQVQDNDSFRIRRSEVKFDYAEEAQKQDASKGKMAQQQATSEMVVPPDIVAKAELGDHFETINPDRLDKLAALRSDVKKMREELAKDESAGGGGQGGEKLLDDLIGVGGQTTPGWGGGKAGKDGKNERKKEEGEKRNAEGKEGEASAHESDYKSSLDRNYEPADQAKYLLIYGKMNFKSVQEQLGQNADAKADDVLADAQSEVFDKHGKVHFGHDFQTGKPVRGSEALRLSSEETTGFQRAAQAEQALKGYLHHRAGNERLTFRAFCVRPMPVPPPVLTDEGLDEDAFIEKYGVRPFVDCARDHFSTFGMDVDTASYALARSQLREGRLPDPGSVRTEEFVNYFKQDYRVEGDEAFGVFAEAMPAPFAAGGLELLKVGIKSREARPDERKAATLTFVVDTSGSMAHGGRLELVRHALAVLTAQLNADDAVAIVAFGESGELVLPRTPARQKQRILDAIEGMTPRGGTNVESGLHLGYRLADESFSSDAVNRVILCSDGVANVGPKGPDEILKLVKVFAARGIDLVTVGFGMGQYNDHMMVKLADQGNGSCHFIDSPAEAERVFREQLPPHLGALARDAKVQVEFNPEAVQRYRLLGYEKRKIADADFRNDAIDSGEVGHATLVTALYEIQRKPGGHGALGKVFLRWKDAGYKHLPVVERNYPLAEGVCAGDERAATPELRFLACVAELAELLRQSRWARDGSYAAVLARLAALPESFRARDDWHEVAELALRAQELSVRTWIERLRGGG